MGKVAKGPNTLVHSQLHHPPPTGLVGQVTKSGDKEKCALLTENFPGGTPPISDLLISVLV